MESGKMFIAIKEYVDKIFSTKKVKEDSDSKFEKWKEEIGYPQSRAHEQVLLDKMGNRWCPIADRDCMLDDCIHF